MTAMALPEATLTKLEKCSGAQEEYSALLTPLLTALISETRTDYAIFRTQRASGFVLEDFKQSETARIPDEQYAIPEKKDTSCWVEHHPFESFGVDSLPKRGRRKNGQRYSQAESAFVSSLREKAWFPIRVGESSQGLVVLVRTSAEPYGLDQVINAWFNSQLYISHSIESDRHATFRNAASYMLQIESETSRFPFLKALADRAGLGWESAWLVEVGPDGVTTLGMYSNEQVEVRERSLLASVLKNPVKLTRQRTVSVPFVSQCQPEPIAAELKSLSPELGETDRAYSYCCTDGTTTRAVVCTIGKNQSSPCETMTSLLIHHGLMCIRDADAQVGSLAPRQLQGRALENLARLFDGSEY